MKKKVLIIFAVVIVMTMTVAFASCGNSIRDLFSEEILAEYNRVPDYKVKDLPVLDDMYLDTINSSSKVVVASNYVSAEDVAVGIQPKYHLINIETGSVLYQGDEEPRLLMDNIYYVNDVEAETYVVYDANKAVVTYKEEYGVPQWPMGNEKTVEGYIVYIEGINKYYAVDDAGNMVETKPSILWEEDKIYRIGDYGYANRRYNNYDSYGVYAIYDNSDKLIRVIDFEKMITTSSTSSVYGPIFIDNKMIGQSVDKVADDSNKYDFIRYGDKCVLTTFSYDVKSDTLSEIDFDMVIEGDDSLFYEKGKDFKSNPYDDSVGSGIVFDRDSVMLNVRPINGNKTLGETIVQNFNSKLKVATDLQKLLPGANGYYIDSNNNLALYLNNLIYAFDNEGNVVYSIDSLKYNETTFGLIASEDGRNLFNLDGTLAYSTPANEVYSFDDYCGRWSLVANEEDQTIELFRFDAKSGRATSKGVIDDFLPVDVSIGYLMLTKNGDVVTVYNPYNGEVLLTISGFTDKSLYEIQVDEIGNGGEKFIISYDDGTKGVYKLVYDANA